MKRPFNETNIKNALDNLIEAYGLTDKLREAQIKEAWNKTMGPFIVNHTRSLSYKQGKLTAKIDSSVIRAELHMAKTAVAEKLNLELRKALISDIDFI